MGTASASTSLKPRVMFTTRCKRTGRAVELENRSPDRIESEWLQHPERYPLINMIHGLLMFLGWGTTFENLGTRLKLSDGGYGEIQG